MKQVCKYRYTIPSMNNLHECTKCRAEMKYGKHINKEEDTELHKNNTEHIIHEQKLQAEATEVWSRDQRKFLTFLRLRDSENNYSG